MKQQINLYTQLPAPKFHFSRNKLLLVYSIFILFLFISLIFSMIKNHNLEKQMRAQELILHQHKQILTGFLQEFPTINIDDLENSLKLLQQRVELRNRVFAILNQESGYENFLISFAKGIVSGVWLTEITFSNVDNTFNITGFGITTQAIQQFLNVLNNDPIFKNMTLNLQELTLVTTDPNQRVGYLNFRAYSRPIKTL